ncbi:MAG: Flp pilus assembly protein CpaB [Anaerosomatales bacterium]|nr:Flp pilus assembly protein CpaB [Anaerosomatales bacterium]MDT8434293.1 Flp pilus assembly protein CpaB [Anaerosomatales bacterium]
MRSKVFILIVAILLGLAAAFFAARYLDSARMRLEAEAQPVEVLVAQQDLQVGSSADQLLESDQIVVENIPRQYVSDGAVSSPASIEGQVLAFPVSKGEQITATRFKYATEVGLSYAVPKDYVAISIPNNAVKGVSGLIKPGDHVMVLATFETGGELEDAITKVIMRKARVIAAGADVTTAETGTTASAAPESQGGGGILGGGEAGGSQGQTEVPGTITLAIPPAEAERVVFAEEQGRVWLALIGSATTQISETPGMTYPGVLE